MSKVCYSPLRYPGGKNRLSPFITKICIENNIKKHYIEPYCGGSAVGLFLLINGYIERITLNDKDVSIYAFWHSVLNNSEELCELIKNCDITISEWKKQKEIQKSKNNYDLLSLGFSTFFLNRTNISGIINSGVIGGIKQNGNYSIDCRFNKEVLINRILNIAKLKENVSLLNIDAIKLIDKNFFNYNYESVLFYLDPPYYHKGSSLYMNHYNNKEHKLVSDKLKKLNTAFWVVSYDNTSEINKLYDGFQKKEFTLNHSAYRGKIGKEVMFFSKNIIQPRIKNYNPIKFQKDKKSKNIIYQSYWF